jgi:hypothetical protein
MRTSSYKTLLDWYWIRRYLTLTRFRSALGFSSLFFVGALASGPSSSALRTKARVIRLRAQSLLFSRAYSALTADRFRCKSVIDSTVGWERWAGKIIAVPGRRFTGWYHDGFSSRYCFPSLLSYITRNHYNCAPFSPKDYNYEDGASDRFVSDSALEDGAYTTPDVMIFGLKNCLFLHTKRATRAQVTSVCLHSQRTHQGGVCARQ